LGDKNPKILLSLISVLHTRKTSHFSANSKVVFLPRNFTSQLQHLDLDVLSTMHFIADAWRLTTPTTIKNCFVKHSFSTDHASSNKDNAVKLDEEDDWHSLQPPGVQFENYTTCDSGFKICQAGVRSTFDYARRIRRREVAEYKVTSLDALKGLEEVRKYVCQFDTENNTVIYNKVQKELQTKLKKKETKTFSEWLKK
jgi:hypothetical protein